MPKLRRWAWAVIRHYWFFLGGTTLGVLGLFVQQYAPNGRLEPWPFYVLCGSGLLAAMFMAWRDEHDRAEQALADYETQKLTYARDVEWQRAIETFQGLWNFDIDAILTKTTRNGVTTETWDFHLFNASGDYAAHVRACEAACRLAGHSLGLSRLWHTLPVEVTTPTDPLDRWLRFVAAKDGFDGMKGSGHQYEGAERVEFESENIDKIHQKSKRLCEYCRNSEVVV